MSHEEFERIWNAPIPSQFQQDDGNDYAEDDEDDKAFIDDMLYYVVSDHLKQPLNQYKEYILSAPVEVRQVHLEMIQENEELQQGNADKINFLIKSIKEG
jgi:hypothetical protein